MWISGRSKADARIGRCVWREGMRQVSLVEPVAFLLIGISTWVKDMGIFALVVRCPFLEMIRNVKRCRIQRCILEINYDNLNIKGVALCRLGVISKHG